MSKPVRRIELKAAGGKPVTGRLANPKPDAADVEKPDTAEVEKAKLDGPPPDFEVKVAAPKKSEKSTTGKNQSRTQKIDIAKIASDGKPSPNSSINAASSARVVRAGDESAANLILKIEREARQADSEAELRFLMVNSTRRIVSYRQAFLLSKKGPQEYITQAISSLSAVDRTSNFVRWIEQSVSDSVKEHGDEETALIKVSAEDLEKHPDAKTYPFGNFVLLPLKLRDGTVFAQLVLARENAWHESDVTPATRLVETYSHAWEALTGPKVLNRRLRDKTLTAILSGVAITAAGFLPIPLTVLAPAEVAASNPVVVSAPLDGVLEKIEIEPNTLVKKGDLLFRFNNTDLNNRVDIAGQNVQVAEARYLQAQRNSFSDPRSKRDLAIALSELKLKAAEYDYTRDLLARSEVRAPQDGLVIFSNKNDWTGKPVSTGERIMRIADPAKVELIISLPVADSIVLRPDARVRLFMDSAPLYPVEAKLKNASYHAKPDIDGVLSYRTVATFSNAEENVVPRIGLRGTAQIHGEKVPLAFYIFRKPLSVMRQWIGF